MVLRVEFSHWPVYSAAIKPRRVSEYGISWEEGKKAKEVEK